MKTRQKAIDMYKYIAILVSCYFIRNSIFMYFSSIFFLCIYMRVHIILTCADYSVVI